MNNFSLLSNNYNNEKIFVLGILFFIIVLVLFKQYDYFFDMIYKKIGLYFSRKSYKRLIKKSFRILRSGIKIIKSMRERQEYLYKKEGPDSTKLKQITKDLQECIEDYNHVANMLINSEYVDEKGKEKVAEYKLKIKEIMENSH